MTDTAPVAREGSSRSSDTALVSDHSDIMLETLEGKRSDSKASDTNSSETTTTDPFSHLPPAHAAHLRDQIALPENEYGLLSLLRYAGRFEVAVLVVCSICSIASGAAMPVMMIVFGGIQDIFRDYLVLGEMTLDDFKDETASFVLYFVYIAIGNFVAAYTSNVGFIYIGEHLTTVLRQRYMESCLRQNIAFFDKLEPGEVAVRLTADINIIQQGVSEKVGLCIAAVSTLISGFVIGFIFSWKLTLILFSTMVALAVNTAFFSGYINKYAVPMATTAAQASGVAEETLSAIRITTAFGGQRRLIDKYDGYLAAAQTAGTKFKIGVSFMMAGTLAILYLNYGLGFWQGATFLRRGEESLNDIITTMMAVTLSVANIGAIAPSIQAFTEAGGRISKILNIIDRKSTLDPTTDEGEKPTAVTGHIRLQNIKQIYPSRPGVTVMDGVSIDFPAQKMTAIIGPSGSGKSTVASLVLRFYDPLEGSVLFDGHDVKSLNLGWLRRQISYVSQEPALFATTIFENIHHGLTGTEYEDADDEKKRQLIEEAARQANAHDFITSLPDGYQTNVGQKGSLLSGGQKQRIAIARAIVSNPKVLVLDEATSALDSKSELAIQQALDQASKGRTTITIAHRLSTIRNADQVVVLTDGKVVEQGTHQGLIEKRGHLYELLNSQKLGSDETETTQTVEDEELVQSLSQLPRTMTAKSVGMNRDGPQPDITQPTDKSFMALVKFLFSFNSSDGHLFAAALFGCVLCGVANPTHSYFFAKQMVIIPQFGISEDPGQTQEDSDFWSLMYLMLGLVQFLTNAVQGISTGYLAERATRKLRKQAFEHMLAQDMVYFDTPANSAAALAAYLAVEPTQAAGIMGTTLGSMLVSATNIVSSVAVALAFGWKLGLVCFSLVPVLFLSGFFQFWLLDKYQERIGKVYAESASFASEYISAMPVVASLCLEDVVARQYSTALVAQKRRSIVSVAKSSILYAASLSMIFLCLGLGFWYGSTLLATFEYDVFQLFICLMAVIFGAQAAGTFCSFFPDIVRSRYSVIQLKELFESRPIVDHRTNTGLSLSATEGHIAFRNVTFSYGSESPAVLRDLNLTIKPSQHVGIVGASGSGKSTIISLLERFYDPTHGQISIDGHDIAKLNINEYRNNVALVNQQPTLFQGTIRENLIMGGPSTSDTENKADVSQETIKRACEDANIYDFIISLPDGFETLCGIGGMLLSGGQKQRIAIARALIRSPKILLLDEATSALDTESEHTVQAALHKAAKGRTTISIAHRLSTLQQADVIHVLEQGRIVESGSHAELMHLGGRYAAMAKLQQSNT